MPDVLDPWDEYVRGEARLIAVADAQVSTNTNTDIAAKLLFRGLYSYIRIYESRRHA